MLDYCTEKVTAQLPSMLWVWGRRLHYLSSQSSNYSTAIVCFPFRFTSMASTSIGANVWLSWHFIHKQSASRALSPFEASGAQFIYSCWHVCSGKKFSCNSVLSSLLGSAKGPRASLTTILHEGRGANRPRKCNASPLREVHAYVRVNCCRR